MDCQQQQDADAISSVQSSMTRLFNENNMYASSMMFTKNCCISVSMTPLSYGREGLQSIWRTFRNSFGVDHLAYYIEQFPLLKDDLAVTTEYGLFYNKEDEKVFKTRGIKVWKKNGGKWYCHMQSANIEDKDMTTFFKSSDI